MNVEESKYYVSRGGKIFGPIEAEPKALIAGSVWVWRFLDKADGWYHWTLSGRWYQDPTKESPNDLVREATEAERRGEPGEWAQLREDVVKVLGEANKHYDKHVDKLANGTAKPMTKKQLLDLAIEAVADRGLNYGKPEDNFARIAAHWTSYLQNRIKPAESDLLIGPTDVAIMCALLKIARLENDPAHADSWVDLAGYAACGGEIALGTGIADEAERAGREGDYGFGWHDWNGGPCPVKSKVKVYYRMRGDAPGNGHGPVEAQRLIWQPDKDVPNSDIIAWRFA